MDDVVDFERDFRRAKQGEQLIYTTLHGLKQDLSQPRQVPNILEDTPTNSQNDECEDQVLKFEDDKTIKDDDETSSEEEEDDDDDDDDEDDDSEVDETGQKKSASGARPRDESPNSRRVFTTQYYYMIHFKMFKKTLSK